MATSNIKINDSYSYRKTEHAWLLRRERGNGHLDTYHTTFKQLELQLFIYVRESAGAYSEAAKDKIKAELRKTLAPGWGQLSRD